MKILLNMKYSLLLNILFTVREDIVPLGTSKSLVLICVHTECDILQFVCYGSIHVNGS